MSSQSNPEGVQSSDRYSKLIEGTSCYKEQVSITPYSLLSKSYYSISYGEQISPASRPFL